VTNNELSRKVLAVLAQKAGTAKFKDLIELLKADARDVFKNLFFLEEKGIVQLSTSYPVEAVYPQIHLVRLRARGETLVKDHNLLDAAFPLSDVTTDLKPHIPPDLNHRGPVTFAQVLDLLAARVREQMQGEERDAILEKIESLLAIPLANSCFHEFD
jgi:DNA-binding MarR family transcriptional regulator